MFDNDHEIKNQALRMWANHIETGNVNTSALDVQNILGDRKPSREHDHRINALNADQHKLVARIRGLADEELKLMSAGRMKALSESSEKSHPKPAGTSRKF